MLKDILVPVAAALLGSGATWFIANSVDFTSKLQREKIANEIMNDDDFTKIVAHDITGNSDFLEKLKNDPDFKGESPSSADVASALSTDSSFVEKVVATKALEVRIDPQRIQAISLISEPNQGEKSKDLGDFSYCALSTAGELHHNQSCVCILTKTTISSWKLITRADKNVDGTCQCGVMCIK